jgi:chorismate mutase
MSSASPDLQDLRRRLDEIDDGLQDLLIDRAKIVSMVAASKRNGNLPAFQPAREAQIIRRLVGRHHGALPVTTLIRMWREMLAATVALQSDFSVAVFAPTGRQGFWDLARDHYGSMTAMAAYNSTGQVIRAVTEGEASVGVLPAPQEGEPDPWWRHLMSTDKNAPRVIARLPFGAPGNARSDGADALAIGRGEQQDTGRDRTLLATECAATIDRARIVGLLASVGLLSTFFTSYGHSATTLSLIEVQGCVRLSDPPFDGFRAELGTALRRLLPFGGYAVPLTAAELAAQG